MMSTICSLLRRLVRGAAAPACAAVCLPLHAAETAVSSSAPSPASAAVPSAAVIWLLVAAIVVMFMHVGFAMIETGFCRAKNALSTVAMTLIIFPLSCLAFWVYGFAVGWGNFSNGAVAPGWSAALEMPDMCLDRGIGIGPLTGKVTGGFAYGLAGTKGLFLAGMESGGAGAPPAINSRDGRTTVGVLAFFFFFMALLGKAALIPTGAMLERWRWKNFCLYGLFSVLPLALAANWVWGGGWLARAGLNWGLGHGVVDFSGAGVIHALGGTIGLVGTWLIGPRTGKYRNGRAQPLPGHHVPMVVLGSLIVAFGWFALNAGCALASSDISLGGVIVNTTLAATGGTLASMLTLGAKKMKPDPTLICNGMIAGLVAISGPCGFVDSWAAVAIGATAGCAVVFSVLLLERRGIDDPAGAISVHGVAGLWGLLSLGIFANGRCGVLVNGVQRERFAVDGVRGLLYGDAGQLAAQAIGAAALVAFGLVVAWTWFQLANRFVPMRVSRDVELEGLDGPELGALAYPDFALTRHA
jgi:Amt family ammonium transporter